MAGLGARLFPAFSKLTSAQVNGYLMDQTIMRFADATARDAAFGGAGEPTLAEGMFCYLDSTNVVQSYNGSAWVSIASSNAPYQNPMGLELVSPTTVTVGSGSASNSNGNITFTTAQAIKVQGVFTDTYRNYRLVIDFTSSTGGGNLQALMLSGATTSGGFTTVGSWWGVSGGTGQSGNIGTGNQGVTYGVIGAFGSSGTNYGGSTVDIMQPKIAAGTQLMFQHASYNLITANYYQMGSALHYTASAYDGIEISTSGTNITGTMRFYGYRNS
jgi:hypothetical protein